MCLPRSLTTAKEMECQFATKIFCSCYRIYLLFALICSCIGQKKLNAMNIKLWRVGCMQSSILIHMGPLFLMQISQCCFSHAFFSSKSPSLVQVSLHQHWIHSFHCHDDCHSSSSKRDCVPSHPCQLLGCCTTPKKMLGDCIPLRGGMIKDSQRHVNVQSSSRLNFA